MRLSILTFGIAKDITGSAVLEWPYDEPLTVGELQVQLLERYPAFRSLASLRLAVNKSYAGPDTPLHPGDEIALIPPVAGG
jgi:molybdopterin converting factor small subunit